MQLNVAAQESKGESSCVRRPAVAVMGANFTTNNMGVSALASGTIKCLLDKFPDATVFFLDYSPVAFVENFRHKGREVPIEFVPIRFSKKIYLSNNIAVLLAVAVLLRVFPSKRLFHRIVSSLYPLQRLCDADFVVSIAGGDSFSDIYGMHRFFFVTLSQIWVLAMKKRLVLLPQTIGPFKSLIARSVARRILRGAELVYSRDFEGVKSAQEMTGQIAFDKFRFAYDLGFILEPIGPKDLGIQGLGERRSGRVRVGINVSGLLYAGGYNRSNMFALKAQYDVLIHRLLEKVLAKDVEVLLIPHVFGEDIESDSGVCAKLYHDLLRKYSGRIGYAAGRYDQSEIKYVIGTCEFFIGSRMHACIAALSQCVPSVAVAYSQKFAGVLNTIGVPDLVLDARALSVEEILAKIEILFESREGTARLLQAKMPDIIKVSSSLFEDMHHASVTAQV